MFENLFRTNSENFEKTLEEKKAENKAQDMLAEMLVEAMLTSETASEHDKLCIRVMRKAKNVSSAAHEVMVKFVTPGKEADTETLKEVLEYLELVEVGIKQFVETTPFVAHTEEE